MKDGNDRKAPGKDGFGTSSGQHAKAQGTTEGGITKRQLWVAPVIMAVNLPDKVFAQASPVGVPTMSPTAPPTN